MTPEQALQHWFSAVSTEDQTQAVRQLVHLANGEDRGEGVRASSILIELVHLARHPADRVALVAQLGACRGQVLPLPALFAEAHAPDPEVRAAALMAIGGIGLPYGAVLVGRWLDGRDVDDEPGEVLEAALLALARTGHPHTARYAEALWATGRVSPAILHAALADAVAPVLLDEARALLHHSEFAIPAALHLASVRVDDLKVLLSPLLTSSDLSLSLVAERLLAQQTPLPEDHFLQVLALPDDAPGLPREARRLRIHHPGELAAAFELLIPPDHPVEEARSAVRVAALSGIAALQEAALSCAAHRPAELARTALQELVVPTPGLAAFLDVWQTSDSERLVAAVARVRVNLFGEAALKCLGPLARASSTRLRCEYVRAHQNALRTQRDATGRTGLAHGDRRTVEARFRTALADEEPKVRELAAFTAGNIGLTGVRDTVVRLLDGAQPWRVRRAAATALSELPSGSDLELLASRCLEEPEASVRFRLIRVLLRAVQEGAEVTAAVVEVARRGVDDADLQVAVLSTVLRGACGDAEGLSALVSDATGAVSVRALAATTSLGVLGDKRALDALVGLARHPDSARRLRAVEALGKVGGERATTVLVDVVMQEQDHEVRRVAVVALEHCPAAAAEVSRLRPRGPDDPLVFELLRARMAALGEGELLSAQALDDRLITVIPGFRPGRLYSRSRAALRALRTAEYLDGVGDLPEGLDAAPPVLFWTKGLELWLNDVMAPVVQTLRQPRTRDGVGATVPMWPGWKRHLPVSWADPAGEDLWAYLSKNLHNALSGRSSASLSLRSVAAVLLLTGPLADTAGLTRWRSRLGDEDRVRLASGLAELAWLRNPLTHRREGTASDAARARLVALDCAGLAAKVG